MKGDIAGPEGAFEPLGHDLLFAGHQPGQRLNDGDLRPEGAPHRGKFHPNHSPAENDGAFGDEVQLQGMLGRDDPPADVQPGEGPGVGTGGQDNVVAPVTRAAHLDGVLLNKPAPAANKFDAAGGNQALKTLVQAGDHTLFESVHTGHLNTFEGPGHPDRLAATDCVGRLGGMKQSLSRDTPAVQARAAKLVALNKA